MSNNERQGDLVLTQGTYVFVQDGATGSVDVIVGPHKVSLADTDKPVSYSHEERRFNRVLNAVDAIRTFPTANQGQYIVLHNPIKEEKEKEKYPSRGKNTTNDFVLNIGHKVNIPGPFSFALYPGQHAEVLDGHQLKSNEYLVVRVYNENAAKANLNNAIMVSGDGKNNDSKISEGEIVIGKLFIIKGTDVSFYIPPTGFEVLKDEVGKYVRNAVTLERLEYCILLAQNGEKRYVKGPDVVFPKPTEKFIVHNSINKFRAIELNENMGIYIKVIAEYTENDTTFKAGDELFITGKEQKIYYPRAEHSLIKYGEQAIHYAIAIPAGEGRYVLDKEKGSVDMVIGPKMYLPDPRKEVIVKRILDDRNIELFYPGNEEAKEYNKSLGEIMEQMNEENGDSSRYLNAQPDYYRSSKTSTLSDEAIAGLGYMDNAPLERTFSSKKLSASPTSFKRSNTHTKPRTITLNTKYEGVVSINVWPGYAIQIIKKNGSREVVEGPKTILLQYDETLECLELSTGKPKSDQHIHRTVYLQTNNNIVSDIIEAETKDSVNVSVRLSYRVNFSAENSKKWFSVSNYVKLLTQHLRSVLRNSIKKHTIEDFNINATDIIRDTVLGSQQPNEGQQLSIDNMESNSNRSGKRSGKSFSENGMNIYDVEVLNIQIGDEKISRLLKEAQYDTVEKNLAISKSKKKLEYVKEIENMSREELKQKSETDAFRLQKLLEQIVQESKNELERLKSKASQQETLNKINDDEISRQRKNKELILEYMMKEADVEIKKVKEKMSSITPGLIEAITSLGTVSLSEILAKNLRIQTSGLHGIFPQGGIEGLMATVKGTGLEKQLTDFLKKTPINTPQAS